VQVAIQNWGNDKHCTFNKLLFPARNCATEIGILVHVKIWHLEPGLQVARLSPESASPRMPRLPAATSGAHAGSCVRVKRAGQKARPALLWVDIRSLVVLFGCVIGRYPAPPLRELAASHLSSHAGRGSSGKLRLPNLLAVVVVRSPRCNKLRASLWGWPFQFMPCKPGRLIWRPLLLHKQINKSPSTRRTRNEFLQGSYWPRWMSWWDLQRWCRPLKARHFR